MSIVRGKNSSSRLSCDYVSGIYIVTLEDNVFGNPVFQ